MTLERNGIPTVTIVTHSFADYGKRITKLQKMPNLPMSSFRLIRVGDIAAGSNALLFQSKPMLNNWFYTIIVLQMMIKPYEKLRKMPKLYFQTP